MSQTILEQKESDELVNYMAPSCPTNSLISPQVLEDISSIENSQIKSRES